MMDETLNEKLKLTTSVQVVLLSLKTLERDEKKGTIKRTLAIPTSVFLNEGMESLSKKKPEMIKTQKMGMAEIKTEQQLNPIMFVQVKSLPFLSNDLT